MKKTLLSLLFLSAALALPAQQEFAPIGAVWHYSANIYSLQTPLIFLRLEAVSDTVVQGRICRKLAQTNIFGWPDSCFYLHQQGDSIWFYNPSVDDFDLLYAFNAQPGDEWTHRAPGTPFSPPTERSFRVDAVSMTTINGRELRRLHISSLPHDYYLPISTEVVDVIGSFHFLLYSFDSFTGMLFDGVYEGPWPTGLRCYSDPELGMYETGIASSCEWQGTSTREALAEPEGIRVFPNPAAGAFTVENLRPGLVSFDVIDLHGRAIWRGQSAGGRTEIAAGLLAPGMYHLAFREEGRWIGRVRVVIMQ